MRGDIGTNVALLPYGSFRVRALLALIHHRWFIRLRWIIAFATLVLLLAERYYTPEFHRPVAIHFCLGALAVVNVIWTLISRDLSATRFDESESAPPAVVRSAMLFANAQMTVDLLILTVILRYSGGIENPMAIFYLFHMIIAALLLTPLNAFLQGCWALLLYSVLAIGECLNVLRPHYSFLTTTNSALYQDWGYVIAGIFVLAAGVFGVLYFTLQISTRLDEQEVELHKANDALRRSQVAIEDLQARRTRFMQTAAHQLKSPLAGIETLAGLLRDGVVPAEKSADILARIVGRCREATAQVTELLTLARVQEATPSRHHAASTDVARAIQKACKNFSDQAKTKSLELHVDTMSCTGVRASVDERDLNDCLLNLLDNALKYTESGGSVWVTGRADESFVSISVKDTGMGIAEESVDDLFDPFRRGNLALAANIPGSGLGLAIVLEVVEQAHGRIEVKSAVGKGSEFTLFFPKFGGVSRPPTVRVTRTATLRNEWVSAGAADDEEG
ncbi:MAG: HAMP domain-containing sensor histidine kinase [Phycisphaerae bacterium]